MLPAQPSPLMLDPMPRAFDDVLFARWHTAAEQGMALSLMLLHVDGLPRLRASRGPSAATLMQKMMLSLVADHSPADAVVLRRGIDDLALVAPGLEAPAAASLAEALCQVVRGLPRPGSMGPLTLSVGVGTTTPVRGGRPWPVDLLEAAEGAQLAARAGGADRVVCRPVRRARRPAFSD